MIRISPLALCYCLIAGPALAQGQDSQTDGSSPGYDLMQQGAELFLRGLQSQIEPTIKDLSDRAEELQQQLEPMLRLLSDQMGEALVALFEKIDDVSNYDMPEILENGDIIIRRKPDAPPFVATPEEPIDGVDL